MSEGGSRKPRLRPEDWIAAAVEALRRDGPRGLRIASLARELGVTPGSFYWHFRDREDFRERILKHWMKHMIAAAGDAAEGAGRGAAQIRALGAILADRDLPTYDLAMRRWAEADPVVATVVARADDLRIRRVKAMLQEAGFGEKAAALRARMILWVHRGAGDADVALRFEVGRELLETLLRDPERRRGPDA